LKIVEGERSRLQVFEGMCIARKNNSVNSKFTVRKMSHGEGVERVFPLFSPTINGIEVIRKGDVKRAKLYYLRDRTGKRARIADRDRGDEADQYVLTEVEEEAITETPAEVVEEKKFTKEKKPVETPIEGATNKTSQKSVEEETVSVGEKSESTKADAENTENESKP
jgi:large subunit ribosomal protein L19